MKITGKIHFNQNRLLVEFSKGCAAVWVDINDLDESQQLQIIQTNRALLKHVKDPSQALMDFCRQRESIQ